MFSVSVTGMVEQPGVYNLPPTSRVSQAILAANLLDIELLPAKLSLEEQDIPLNQLETLDFDDMYIPEVEEVRNASTREVILRRDNKDIILDLASFYNLGKIENNPYIKDGDVIYIPPVRNSVEIAGEINKPGSIEIKDGETIADIVDLAQGFTSYANTNKIRVSRLDLQTGELVEITDNYSNLITNLTLQNNDYIFIEKNKLYQNRSFVSVYNGDGILNKFYIQEDKTTLLNLLENMSLNENRVDLKHSFIQRTNKNELIDPEFERLKLLRPEEMSFHEYAYFKASLRELKGKFSLDMNDLFINKNASLDITLKNGDFIYLSGTVNTILVTGSVKNPGLLEYVPGKNYQYYIDIAGGLTTKAKKARLE